MSLRIYGTKKWGPFELTYGKSGIKLKLVIFAWKRKG